MKKILGFICMALVCIFNAAAVTRGNPAQNRTKAVQTAPIEKTSRTSATTTKATTSRTTQINPNITQRKSDATSTRSVATRTPVNSVLRTADATPRTTTSRQNVISRAATTTQSTPIETRTGAEYEQCKAAFFTCMDQFCEMKNDTFKRCSCSDRVYKLQNVYENYQKVGENLNEFTENLDVVGMTYEQAIAMKTATEGEDALTADKSASKQLLQAIMNAIKGENASVGGKYQDLNSITIASDVTNAFGLDNSGQIIASYNGATLYKSVFPTCKSVVKDDCNNASLQRAINAYLMSIEQDCNTIESALKQQQKTLIASTHENSAMLDLARVENHQKHNSDDIAACISNVESAIKSDEVCGENYHKCLDYGQFIDVTTGAPLTGVVDFYKLGEMLTFSTGESLENQKLSSISDNRQFVQFFENKTKKFAQPALDKCVENADTVWKEYLDMALIDIYYAQKSKVDDIEQNCFNLITACYEDKNAAIANAMANLTGDYAVLLKPASVDLTHQICSDYTESCNNMFSGNVIKTYLGNKKSTDSEAACRVIAQQCFDKFGGTGYENFYSPQSGLFEPGYALDWFSLYDSNHNYISPCAQELASTEGCNNEELLERVFGGFAKTTDASATNNVITNNTNTLFTADNYQQISTTGVASEVYAKIINNLSVQCENINGYFIKPQLAVLYGYNPDSLCEIDTTSRNSIFYINNRYNTSRQLHYWYRFKENENMCPQYYGANVDVQSWGTCSCWENGGYRSKNGTIPVCRPLLPISGTSETTDPACSANLLDLSVNANETQWCQQSVLSSLKQVCPQMQQVSPSGTSYSLCAYKTTSGALNVIDIVLENVHQHKVTETETLDIYDAAQVHTTTSSQTTSVGGQAH